MAWLVGATVWVLLCILVAKVAKSLGRHYWGYLILSIALSPLIGALVLAIAHLSRPTEPEGHPKATPQDRAATDAQVEEWVRRLRGPTIGSEGDAPSKDQPSTKHCLRCGIAHPGTATHCVQCGERLNGLIRFGPDP